MTDIAWRTTQGAENSPFLLIADHASNRVPDDIDLGIAPELLTDHIAIDRGVAELGRALCAALNCPGIFANISRLVVDLNREEDAPHIIPHESDGHSIPGNAISPAARAARPAVTTPRPARSWRKPMCRTRARTPPTRPDTAA